jgi:hypothetical protein
MGFNSAFKGLMKYDLQNINGKISKGQFVHLLSQTDWCVMVCGERRSTTTGVLAEQRMFCTPAKPSLKL